MVVTVDGKVTINGKFYATGPMRRKRRNLGKKNEGGHLLEAIGMPSGNS